MYRSQSSRSVVAFAVALTLLAVLAVMATGVVGRTVSPAPSPIAHPSAAPSGQPSVAPSADPTVAPTPTPAPAPTKAANGSFEVDLDIATAHDVSVLVDDDSGTVVDARSGRAGDGMSVRWHDVQVENVDADTLRITWVGLPVDDVLGLSIARVGDGLRLAFTQGMPYPNTDALGGDRVLVLDFDAPVSAGDVTATFAD